MLIYVMPRAVHTPLSTPLPHCHLRQSAPFPHPSLYLLGRQKLVLNYGIKMFSKSERKNMRKKRQANIEQMPPSGPLLWPRPLLADVLKCLSRPIQEDECVSEVCGAQQIKRRQLAALPDCRTSADRVCVCGGAS